jgi:hypothetical protein
MEKLPLVHQARLAVTVMSCDARNAHHSSSCDLIIYSEGVSAFKTVPSTSIANLAYSSFRSRHSSHQMTTKMHLHHTHQLSLYLRCTQFIYFPFISYALAFLSLSSFSSDDDEDAPDELASPVVEDDDVDSAFFAALAA